MNARAILASKVNALKGDLSFRDLSRAILDKTGQYISHSTLYQYALADGKSPSPENLDVLAAYAGKPASWFYEDVSAAPHETQAPPTGTELLARHVLDDLQAIHSRLTELESLRSDAGQLKALDADQRARMLDFLSAKTGPMVTSERRTVESYLDSWPEITAVLGDKAPEGERLLSRIIDDFFPSLAFRLESRRDGL